MRRSHVEFSVDCGGGEAAMTAMKMMGSIESGLANPYAGLGDQASQVGPALMIRTGEDLVTLVFAGVEDSPAKAKKIFDAAMGGNAAAFIELVTSTGMSDTTRTDPSGGVGWRVGERVRPSENALCAAP